MQFKPSGDALFDRLASSVASRWSELAPQYDAAWRAERAARAEGKKPDAERMALIMEYSALPLLPDCMLAEWEAEFGRDRRYWQLRAFCAMHRHDAGGHYFNNPLPYRWLIKAYELGLADMDTLLPLEHLFNMLAPDFVDRQWQFTCLAGMQDVKRKAQGEKLIRAEMKQRQQLAREIARPLDFDLAAFGEKLCAIEPDRAQAYYWNATYAITAGDFDTAERYLEKGNVAPVNREALPFPLSLLAQQMSSGAAQEYGWFWGGSSLLGAMVSSMHLHGSMELKKYLRRILHNEPLNRLSELNAVYRALCRMAQAEHASRYELMAASIILHQLLSGLLDKIQVELSRSAKDELWRAASRARLPMEEIKIEQQSRMDQLYSELDSLSYPEPAESSAESESSQAQMIHQHDSLFQHLVREDTQVRERWQPQLRPLLDLDLRELLTSH